LVRAPDADTARAIPTADRYAGIEVRSWQFDGRPSLPIMSAGVTAEAFGPLAAVGAWSGFPGGFQRLL
jgi:hypothetical protein